MSRAASPSTSPPGRRDLWVGLAIAVAFAVLFLALRAETQLKDSLGYAFAAKTGESELEPSLIHPHHLLYKALLRGVHLLLSSLADIEPLVSVQIHQVLLTALGVAALYGIVLALGGVRWVAAWAACLAGLSNAVWLWSTQAEPYGPVFGLLGLTAFLLLAEAPGQRWARTVLAPSVAWTASIVLYHQAAVLFVVPLVTHALVGGPRRLAQAVQIALLSGAASLLIYIAVYVGGDEGELGVAAFLRWTLHYATLDAGWGSAGNLSGTGLRDVVRSVLANLVTAPGPARMPAYALAAGFVGVALLWNAVAVLRGATAWRGRLVLLAWAATNLAFIWWWVPTLRQFLLPNMVPLVALGALALCDAAVLMERRGSASRRLAGASVAAVLLLGLANLVDEVVPRHLSRGPYYAEAARQAAMEPAGCALWTTHQEFHNLKFYFADQRVAHSLSIVSGRFQRQEAAAPPGGDRLERLRQGCVLLPAAEIAAGSDVLKFLTRGGQEPEARERFLGWLVAAEGDGAPAAGWQMVEGPSGQPFLLIDYAAATPGGDVAELGRQIELAALAAGRVAGG